MNLYRILLLLLGLSAAAAGHTQSGQRDHKPPPAWNLKKDQDGIKVYGRAADSSVFDELKVETTVAGRLSSLTALILDIGNYPKWSFNSEKAYVIKTVGPAELYFYSLVHSPWPASDRDLAVHLTVRQDSTSRKLYISADEIANFIPEKKGIVRVPLSVERWVVTPLPGDRIAISYELRLNPGASAPAWLINLFATKGPFETFSHLREQLKLPRYHGAALPFIRN